MKHEVQSVVLSHIKKPFSITPIYDSGSSLGREKTNEEVERMLITDGEIDSYIRRGKSEIHWNQKKVSHFELVAELLQTSYAEMTENIIIKVVGKYDDEDVKDQILKVDKLVPESMLIFRLPESRKRLMYKLIDLRIAHLKKLIE
jgi:hypothetical protein